MLWMGEKGREKDIKLVEKERVVHPGKSWGREGEYNQNMLEEILKRLAKNNMERMNTRTETHRVGEGRERSIKCIIVCFLLL